MALIVNGQKVEDSAIQREVERLRPKYEEVFADQPLKEREARLLQWSRDNVIEMTLLNQDAKENGREIPEEQVDSFLSKLQAQHEELDELYKKLGLKDSDNIKEHIRMHLKVEQRLQDICKNLPKPSKAAIRKYYEENTEQFKVPERIRVAHIVKYINWQTDEQTAYQTMKQAQEDMKKGAAFETVVNKYNDCADRGGDLGYITRGRMAEEFDDVVFNLGSGQVSDVFRTRFGYHIAKVYDRRPAAIAELKEVESRIVETLKEQIKEKTIDDFIDHLKSKAKIEEV